MPKNIVLCSDGTGNSGGKGNNTNVWRLFTSVDKQSYKATPQNPPCEQRAFYDDGVGTDRLKLLKLLGGAFGFGLSRNLKQLYATLAANFEPGDHIYLFGFSRGAFTVRTLAGLITTCGIVDRRLPDEDRILDDEELKARVKAAYQIYRQKYSARLTLPWDKQENRRDLKHLDATKFRQQYGVQVSRDHYLDYENLYADPSEEKFVPIRFMGVWDTVDAVGFPVEEIASFWNENIYQFKFSDHALSPWVNKACQALSIDDERRSFHPLLFNESDPRDEKRIEQVWFPGVHSNVGGGYPKQGMAHMALNWMMAKAEAANLRFDEHCKRGFLAAADMHDKLYDSRSGISIYYRYKPRDLKKMCANEGLDAIHIHISTFHRILACTENYAPGNLSEFKVAVDDPAYNGESPANQEALVNTCSAGWSNDEDKAYDQSRLVEIRHALHIWFIAASAFVFVAGYLFGKFYAPVTAPSNPLLTLAGAVTALVPLVGNFLYQEICVPLFSHMGLGLFILGIPVYLYAVDILLKKKQEGGYQKFWRRTLSTPWWH